MKHESTPGAPGPHHSKSAKAGTLGGMIACSGPMFRCVSTRSVRLSFKHPHMQNGHGQTVLVLKQAAPAEALRPRPALVFTSAAREAAAIAAALTILLLQSPDAAWCSQISPLAASSIALPEVLIFGGSFAQLYAKVWRFFSADVCRAPKDPEHGACPRRAPYIRPSHAQTGADPSPAQHP